MWLWVVMPSAWAATPEVTLRWKKDQSTLQVVAPPGEKVSEEAPVDLVLSWPGGRLHAETDGTILASGLPMGPVSGREMTGELELGLCALDGSSCRITRWALEGETPDAKKGAVSFVVSNPADRHEPTPFGPDADTHAAEQAFARAATGGTAVLLDFSAVWCPPCNLLAAEVLHADPADDALSGYEVAVVDVDHPSSWELKDKYEVGGYPTVVVTAADGTEKARLVGYPGREAFLTWLATAAGSTDAADLAKDPAEVDPVRAAKLAWSLVEQGEPDAAAPWLARAAAAPPDLIELRLARAQVEHRPEDFRWLVDHAPERVSSFAGGVDGIAESDPALAAEIVALGIRSARGADLADMLWMAGELEPDAARKKVLYGAAASALAGSLSGDPERDKGHLGWLARLQALSGDTAGAIARLEEASAHFANEPTFDLSLVSLLLEAERKEEALAAAERAFTRSWGDTRLRAASAKAEVLVALDRKDEAAALAKQVLDAEVPPAEGVDVRTHNYRKRLAGYLQPG